MLRGLLQDASRLRSSHPDPTLPARDAARWAFWRLTAPGPKEKARQGAVQYGLLPARAAPSRLCSHHHPASWGFTLSTPGSKSRAGQEDGLFRKSLIHTTSLREAKAGPAQSPKRPTGRVTGYRGAGRTVPRSPQQFTFCYGALLFCVVPALPFTRGGC